MEAQMKPGTQKIKPLSRLVPAFIAYDTDESLQIFGAQDFVYQYTGVQYGNHR